MALRAILKESDGSFIRLYQVAGQQMNTSYFAPEELPPVARHEDVPDPPSEDHEWNGISWVVALRLSVADFKTNLNARTRDLGRDRVLSSYDEQDQRRLAFAATTDIDRIACRDLIMVVRTEVIRVLSLIAAASTRTQAKTAADSLNLPA